MSFESCVESLKEAIINHCSGLISTHNTDSTAHSNIILSNWTEVYNKSGLVIKYNSTIGLCSAQLSVTKNFTNTDTITLVNDIPSAYRPSKTMSTVGHNSTYAVVVGLTSSGNVTLKRLSGTGSLTVTAEWVYLKQ